VNGRVNAGPGAVWASLSGTQGGKDCPVATTVIGNAACGSSGKARMTVVGYDYVMSKRTKMFAAFAKIDNGFDGTTGTNYYYIAGPAAQGGGPVANVGRGNSGNLAAGTDVTTIALGMQHSF